MRRRRKIRSFWPFSPGVLNPVAVFNKTTPIVVGVDVVEGQLKTGTPIAVVKTNSVTKAKEVIELGRV